MAVGNNFVAPRTTGKQARARAHVIDLAVCVDNNDPRGACRIRSVIPFGQDQIVGQLADAITFVQEEDKKAKTGRSNFGNSNEIPNYVPWEDSDPFIITPFLPQHLNIIPKEDELHKIIYYDPINKSQNAEYIGPLISQFQTGGYQEHYSKGSMWTSKEVDFRPEKGVPISSSVESKGVIPNPGDIAIKGRGGGGKLDGADVILGMKEKVPQKQIGPRLEDGSFQDSTSFEEYPQVLIRTGAMIRNQTTPNTPAFNTKYTGMQLATFPNTLVLEKFTNTREELDDQNMRGFIEYHIDNWGTFNGGTGQTVNGGVSFYIMTGYDASGATTSATTIPENDGNVPENAQGGVVDGQVVAPTNTSGKLTCSRTWRDTPVDVPKQRQIFKQSFNGVTSEEYIKEVNDFISEVHNNNWTECLKQDPDNPTKSFDFDTGEGSESMANAVQGNTHPLWFRPNATTRSGLDTTPPTVASNGLNEICNKIKLGSVVNNGFMIEPKKMTDNDSVPTKTVEFEDERLNTIPDQQQGFVVGSAEKIYFVSHSSNSAGPDGTQGTVNMTDNYGLTQEQLIKEVDSSTNSMVRGEPLIKLLKKIVEFLKDHKHACANKEADAGANDEKGELDKLIQEASETVLNQNIRIN